MSLTMKMMFWLFCLSVYHIECGEVHTTFSSITPSPLPGESPASFPGTHNLIASELQPCMVYFPQRSRYVESNLIIISLQSARLLEKDFFSWHELALILPKLPIANHLSFLTANLLMNEKKCFESLKKS